MRQHPVELDALADAQQLYRLHVLVGHVFLVANRRHAGRLVGPLSALNGVEPFRHVGIRHGGVALRLPRRLDGGRSDIHVLVTQPLVLVAQPLVQRRAQQRLQRHALLLFKVAHHLLRLLPPCRRHQANNLVLRRDKHNCLVLLLIYDINHLKSKGIPHYRYFSPYRLASFCSFASTLGRPSGP